MPNSNISRNDYGVSFKKSFIDFENMANLSGFRFKLSWDEVYPCLDDKTTNTDFDAHYIYHTAWATRVVKKINPQLHVDISSYLYFSTILSAFIPVDFYDYRPANIKLSNLKLQHADLCNLQFANNSINSLSCLHVIEHIGLGRYGDPLDYNGDLKAISELKRVVKHGGDLIIAVPIGKPKIMFNAHRIYSFDQIIENFKGFVLQEFSLIPDNGVAVGIIENATKELADKQTYGCGCFWFKRANYDFS